MIKMLHTLKEKWPAYLLEMIVITASILGAFMLENWSSGRDDRNIEKQYLHRFNNELTLQADLLDSIDDFFTNNIKIAESILYNYQLRQDFTQIDSLNYKLGLLMWTRGFPNINSAYNDISSSGQMRLILDSHVREKIVAHYENNEVRYKAVADNYKLVFYPQIFPTLKDLVYIDLKEFKVDSSFTNSNTLFSKHIDFIHSKLSDQQNELDLINSISLVLAMTNRNRFLARNASEECQSLQTLIENTIQK